MPNQSNKIFYISYTALRRALEKPKYKLSSLLLFLNEKSTPFLLIFKRFDPLLYFFPPVSIFWRGKRGEGC